MTELEQCAFCGRENPINMGCFNPDCGSHEAVITWRQGLAELGKQWTDYEKLKLQLKKDELARRGKCGTCPVFKDKINKLDCVYPNCYKQHPCSESSMSSSQYTKCYMCGVWSRKGSPCENSRCETHRINKPVPKEIVPVEKKAPIYLCKYSVRFSMCGEYPDIIERFTKLRRIHKEMGAEITEYTPECSTL